MYQVQAVKTFSKEEENELIKRAGLTPPDEVIESRSIMRFNIAKARDYSKIKIENVQEVGNTQRVTDMQIEEFISMEDTSSAAFVEIYPTYQRNSKNIILGNWKNGLTTDEIEFLKSKHNLPNFEEDKETSELPSWRITNNFSLNLNVLAEQAIANVILSSSLIADTEENMNWDKETKAYFFFEEDTKTIKNRKAEAIKRNLKKFFAFSNDANDEDKAMLAELLTYQNAEIIVENHSQEEYLDFFESLALPENSRLLFKLCDLIDKVSSNGAKEVLKKTVYFHRLLNMGEIQENFDTGQFVLKLTETKTEELGVGYEAALTRWKAIANERTAPREKAEGNLPKTESKFQYIDAPKVKRPSLSSMIQESPIEEAAAKEVVTYNEETDEEEKFVIDTTSFNLATATELECDEWAKSKLKGKPLDEYLSKKSETQKKTVLKKLLNKE